MNDSKNSLIIYDLNAIQRKIYSIREFQVMLDSDLAEFYGVETKVLNQAVRRNIERFPEEFMFQLEVNAWESLKCQIGTSNYDSLRSQFVTSKSKKGGRRYLPYVFTEQGVAMLSGVLRSETAIKMSIQIINAFVAMRKFIINNAQLFQRIDNVERKQLEHEIKIDKRFDEVFDALQSKEVDPKQGIFYDGQIFDAYKFVSDLIRKAEKSILLIDNYIDDTILDLFTKRKKNVEVIILTKKITKEMELDLEKFNAQYPAVKLKEFKESHDRFMIIDSQDVYHFGASLKDLGKKWFAFSKFDNKAIEFLQRLNEKNL
jgi:hypothetical protein